MDQTKLRMNNYKRLTSISSSTMKASSFDTLYEWEKIISDKLDLKIDKQSKIRNWIYRQIEIRLKLRDLFLHFVPSTSLSLLFVMTAKTQKGCRLTKNTIPVIIDFWLKENQLKSFYENFKHCPLILISSAEVYHFLLSHNCPLNIEHWPLSLPDSQKLSSDAFFEKKWELALLGRTNPYFLKMLEMYCEKHPDFEYVLGNNDIDNRYFYTNTGKKVGHAVGREAYLEMLRTTKITFYTTPGLDLAKHETDFFNQVTPRFLEFLAAGCLVMAHYPKNEDTDFYELNKLCKDVDSYEEFEKQLDMLRKIDEVPIATYSDYLSKHYTSMRLDSLVKILGNNNIKIQAQQ
jgi:hypothetical protein